jgi:hypothetical protein
MSLETEVLKIEEMVADGKLTPEEATHLIESIPLSFTKITSKTFTGKLNPEDKIALEIFAVFGTSSALIFAIYYFAVLKMRFIEVWEYGCMTFWIMSIPLVISLIWIIRLIAISLNSSKNKRP